MNALAVRNLSYAHPKGKGNIPAFADLAFTLEAGELLCLAGINGSGKTTLLCLLAGLYPSEAGTLEVFGRNLVGAGEKSLRAAREETALLLQDADMQIIGGTVEEDLLLTNRGSPEEALRMAERFGLAVHLQRPPHTLSYGQKRKLCLASALLRKPRLLLLDEPFSGLDYPAVKELRLLLQSLRQEGVTLVVSTHDLEPLLAFTDRLLFIGPSPDYYFGRPEDVLSHAAAMGIRPPLVRDFA